VIVGDDVAQVTLSRCYSISQGSRFKGNAVALLWILVATALTQTQVSGAQLRPFEIAYKETILYQGYQFHLALLAMLVGCFSKQR
jgi:hypothetical protein